MAAAGKILKRPKAPLARYRKVARRIVFSDVDAIPSPRRTRRSRPLPVLSEITMDCTADLELRTLVKRIERENAERFLKRWGFDIRTGTPVPSSATKWVWEPIPVEVNNKQ